MWTSTLQSQNICNPDQMISQTPILTNEKDVLQTPHMLGGIYKRPGMLLDK